MQQIRLLFEVSRVIFERCHNGNDAVCTAVEGALRACGIRGLRASIVNGHVLLCEDGIAQFRAPITSAINDFLFAYNGDQHVVDSASQEFAGFLTINDDDQPVVALVGFTAKLIFESY